MPSLSSSASNEKVLVTGASGYIAAWIVRTLLEKGYTVRGTVRSESKGQYLSKTFAEFGNRFEYVIVDDIEKVDIMMAVASICAQGFSRKALLMKLSKALPPSSIQLVHSILTWKTLKVSNINRTRTTN